MGVRFDAGGVDISPQSEKTQMTCFTLSRADIRSVTGWGYLRTRAIIDRPYRLQSQLDPSGPTGGGRVERFRLGDVLARLRSHPHFSEHFAIELGTADAVYREDTK